MTLWFHKIFTFTLLFVCAYPCKGIYKQKLLLSPQMFRRLWKRNQSPKEVQLRWGAAESTRSTHSFQCSSCSHTRHNMSVRIMTTCIHSYLVFLELCSTSKAPPLFSSFSCSDSHFESQAAAGSGTTFHNQHFAPGLLFLIYDVCALWYACEFSCGNDKHLALISLLFSLSIFCAWYMLVNSFLRNDYQIHC